MNSETQNRIYPQLPEDWKSFINEWNSSKNNIQVHTSGSTGVPKELTLSREMLIHSALRTNHFFNINSESLLYSCVGPQFIGGKMMYVRANIANAQFFAETPSNRPILNVPHGETIDLLAVVPSQMINILARKNDLPIIKNILIGGSAINESLRAEIACSGLRCYETYGMTETASHIALRRISVTDSKPFELLPGISISSDERDCLIINLKEDNIEVHTHDIVEIVNDSEFFIHGRIDNVINTGGRKIIVEQLESKLFKLLQNPVALTSLSDRKWGEKLIAIIETETVLDAAQIRTALKRDLLPHEIPKEFIFVNKLPRTLNGKIDRNALLKFDKMGS